MAVNQLVAGSSPARGAMLGKAVGELSIGLSLFLSPLQVVQFQCCFIAAGDNLAAACSTPPHGLSEPGLWYLASYSRRPPARGRNARSYPAHAANQGHHHSGTADKGSSSRIGYECGAWVENVFRHTAKRIMTPCSGVATMSALLHRVPSDTQFQPFLGAAVQADNPRAPREHPSTAPRPGIAFPSHGR